MTRASGTVRSKRSPSGSFSGFVTRKIDCCASAPAEAAQHVEVLDGGGDERHEAVELVDAADGVDHPLPRQHLVGQQVAQAAGETRLDGVCHGTWSAGCVRSGTGVRIRTGDLLIHNQVL